LEIQNAPAQIDIVLINRPDLPANGAGEPSTRTVPAAIANALFHATSVRIRRVPITSERVRTALARA
jgi:nicotinate dehydrogenase subunit B